MNKNQNNSSRNPSYDIFKCKTRNLTEPCLSNKSQLTSMKKSSKPVVSKGVIPVKVVSRNVSISNYIAGHTTNNITVNINHPVMQCKSERMHSKNNSIVADPFKVKSKYIKSNRNTMASSLTFESSRNVFNTIDSKKKDVTQNSSDKEDSIKKSFVNKIAKKPKGVIKQVIPSVTHNEYLHTNNEDDVSLENMIHMYTIDRFKNVRRDAERSLYDLSEYYVNDDEFNEVKLEAILVDSTTADVLIHVKERWYLFPIPYFRWVDRNFSQWWNQQNRSLDRVNYGINFRQSNFTGNNDRLVIGLITGYTHQAILRYQIPFIDKKLQWGVGAGIQYYTQKEMNFATNADKQVFYKSEKILRDGFRGNANVSYRPNLFERVNIQVGLGEENITGEAFTKAQH